MKALIFIADGTEEMELYVENMRSDLSYSHNSIFSTIAYDTLVRAGIQCTSAYVKPLGINDDSANPLVAECSRGMKIIPDVALSTVVDPVRRSLCVLFCREETRSLIKDKLGSVWYHDCPWRSKRSRDDQLES